MNGIDLAILCILVVCAGFGLWKGFVRMAVGLGGLGVTLALALRLSAAGPRWFSRIFASDEISRAAAFALVLIAGLLLTSVVAWLAAKLVRSAEIGWLDRLLGGGVAAVGSLLVLSGLMVGITTFAPSAASWTVGSRLMPVMMAVSDEAARILPDDVERIYRSHRERISGRTLVLPEEGGAEAEAAARTSTS
jgi:membrane protein required for colicin V production